MRGGVLCGHPTDRLRRLTSRGGGQCAVLARVGFEARASGSVNSREIGCNHGDAELLPQVLVHSGAEDDIGIWSNDHVDALGDLIDVLQGHRRPTGNREDDATRSLHRKLRGPWHNTREA